MLADRSYASTKPQRRAYVTDRTVYGTTVFVLTSGQADVLSTNDDGADRFEWGPSSSSRGTEASSLAFAMLSDATDADFARDHHEQFRRDVVDHLPREGWKYFSQRIQTWAEFQGWREGEEIGDG